MHMNHINNDANRARPGYVGSAIRIAAAPAQGGGNAEDDNFARWTPRDTFSWVSDGLSNTLFLGEKFVPTSNALANCTNNIRFDCSFLWTAGGNHQSTVARHLRDNTSDISIPNDTPITDSANNASNLGFGSWHPGVIHFALGDGAIRAVPRTIDRILLRQMARVNDGLTPAVP